MELQIGRWRESKKESERVRVRAAGERGEGMGRGVGGGERVGARVCKSIHTHKYTHRLQEQDPAALGTFFPFFLPEPTGIQIHVIKVLEVANRKYCCSTALS
jgi:hypothetical protein